MIGKKMRITAVSGLLALSMTSAAFAAYHVTDGPRNVTFAFSQAPQEGRAGVIEENFDPSAAKGLTPGQSFRKSAAAVSYVSYRAHAFLMIEMPTVSAKLGNDTEKKVYDLAVPDAPKAGWTLCGRKVSTAAGTPSRYVYRYMKELPAGEKTSNAVESFRVQDFTAVSAFEGDITIKGYMVQFDNVSADDAVQKACGYFGADKL